MNTTHVRNALTGAYESRAWSLPLIVICCPRPCCSFEAIAVSGEAADAGIWEHTVAMHLGESYASKK